MTREIIRLKLHELIDQLSDTTALEKLYAEALEFKYSAMEDDPFSDELWDEIDKGLAELRNGEPCTHEAAVEMFREWQSKK